MFRKRKSPTGNWVVHIEKGGYYWRVWVHPKGGDERYHKATSSTLKKFEWTAQRWARRTVARLERVGANHGDGRDHIKYEL